MVPAQIAPSLLLSVRARFGTDLYWDDLEWLAKRRGLQTPDQRVPETSKVDG
jgi:hypothetical protein